MLPVVTAEEMRELDRVTIEEIGLPGAVLMETAGRRIAATVAELGGPVAVVCGAGNNGGDGFVCARVLREAGIEAAVYMAMDADKVRGDAALHLGAYQRAGGAVFPIDTAADLESERGAIEAARVIVDAVFGTGLSRPIEGHLARVIELIDRAPGQVVAADVPSGLDADTGRVLGVCARAATTVTMAFAKVGLVTDPGFVYTGDLRIAEIGIPASLARRSGVSVGLVERADAEAWIPPMSPSDHKGRRGHLLVIAGSPGKRGAARLSARGGLRAGAGLVTIAGAGEAGTEIEVPDPVMAALLDRGRDPGEVAALLEGKAAIALGPGMPTDDWGKRLLDAVIEAARAPLVIDADGLNQLSGRPERLAGAAAPLVITPHPGEAARLLGRSTAEIQSDRLGAARALAEKSGAVCVLKGARTVVCDAGGGEATINPTGTPALATAGSGDVLTGVIGGLLAQGLEAPEAARLGVYVHGLAGELAAADLGARSVTASDVAEAIADALVELTA